MKPLIRLLMLVVIAWAIVIGTPTASHADPDGSRAKTKSQSRTAHRSGIGKSAAGACRVCRRPVVGAPGVTAFSGPRPYIRRAPQGLLHRRPFALRSAPSSSFFAPFDSERARILDGARIHVIDGDTFAYGGEKIRIRGFDAPELLEPGGFEAMKRLDELLREGQVAIVPDAVDVYGRLVADVYVDQTSVAETMKFEGYAKPTRR